jgi:hypothetical protein
MSYPQISFVIPPDFILSRARLTLADIARGFRKGWIDRDGVVSLCLALLQAGTRDPVVEELACLLMDERTRVDEILVGEVAERSQGGSDRLWLYLTLAWVYENRDRIDSLLDVVELIYSDFDYPEEMEDFVPYMPAPAGAEASKEGLVARWKAYLDSVAADYFPHRSE